MIEIKNIRRSFGDRVIIDDISAVMQTGKCNLIIGTSGSGKTVLTKCMIGLFKPDNGDIIYDGESMISMNDEEKKTTAENRNAFSRLSFIRFNDCGTKCNVSVKHVH